MSPLRALALSLALLGAPRVALADVPGAPPAEPPDCPAGTRLEGPYRYWSCVPCRPDEACGAEPNPVPVVVEPPAVPAAVEPPAAPAAVEPPAATTNEAATPPAAEPASRGDDGFGCSVAPACGGRAWTLLLVLCVLAALRRSPLRRRR